MDKKQILDAIAPCSLCCYTCPGKKNGIIANTAKTLCHYFEGYYDFNRENLPERHQAYTEKMRQFTDQLEKQSNPTCNGCRDNTHGKCCIKGCFILECSLNHEVSFCAECKEFPCNKLTTDIFNPIVIAEWKKGNERIREVGIERFYEEITARSHYLPFKK